MAQSRRPLRWLLWFAFCAVLGAAACDLNPQPLPPGANGPAGIPGEGADGGTIYMGTDSGRGGAPTDAASSIDGGESDSGNLGTPDAPADTSSGPPGDATPGADTGIDAGD